MFFELAFQMKCKYWISNLKIFTLQVLCNSYNNERVFLGFFSTEKGEMSYRCRVFFSDSNLNYQHCKKCYELNIWGFFFLIVVFKVRTARRDGVKYNMKLFTDMKPEKKLSIKKFANHRIQKSCSCGVLELKGNVKMQHHRVSKEIA